MANTIVLGMQWGDEGKGKIVDLICPAFDAVARFQGGDNAGHTVKFGDEHFALHLLPSGILQDGMDCVLGNGMVINPGSLFEELDGLIARGTDPSDRLHISDRAHVILPSHAAVDRARETARGDQAIGTTARGIGPCYESKAARSGVRAGDLGAADLDAKLEALFAHASAQLAAAGSDEQIDQNDIRQQCRRWAERFASHVVDTSTLLNHWIDDGKSILFEGAQGALLDLDHGTYPFVTSSNATAGGVCTGTGVAPTRVDGVLAVVKAYTTRVGAGPFATELDGEVGEHLRRRGNEFGTTTGRPRRCGWFDAVAARYSRRINGVDVLALTKLDVLDELEEIKICVGYRLGDDELDDMPTSIDALSRIEPVYRTVPGWQASTEGVLDFAKLPAAARDYIALLEAQVGAQVGIVSTGPRREETLLLDSPALQRLLGDGLPKVLAHRDQV